MTLSALKEWDAQCQLLLGGQTSLLIRKGGIREIRQGFEVKHERFLLYPTFVHQNPEELQPQYHGLLHADPSPGLIHLPALAEVVAVHKIESLEQARALEPLQALTADAIERKFHYRDRPWVHALLLRVSPLQVPLTLPETRAMIGCVSWVPLIEQAEQVDRIQVGAAAVPDDELRARAARIERLIG